MKERSRLNGDDRDRDQADQSLSTPQLLSQDHVQLDLNSRLSRHRPPRLSRGLGLTKPTLSLALLAVLSLLAMLGHSVIINCATNCKSCFGPGANQCTTCNPGWRMQSNECRNTACDAGYTEDTRDRLCKRTINDIDHPCEPGKYNAAKGAIKENQCQVCLPGKSTPTYLNLSSPFSLSITLSTNPHNSLRSHQPLITKPTFSA